MTSSGETSGERQPRLIPPSPLAVRLGVERAMATGSQGWEKALREFASHIQLSEAMKGLASLRAMAVRAEDTPWTRTLSQVGLETHLSGGAVYLQCLKEEGRQQKQPLPQVTPEDRAFWTETVAPESLLPAPTDALSDVQPRLRDVIARQEGNYQDFTTTHPDFCALIDEAPWPQQTLTDIKIGAADLYGLFLVHYDRVDEPTLVPHKTSWGA